MISKTLICKKEKEKTLILFSLKRYLKLLSTKITFNHILMKEIEFYFKKHVLDNFIKN